MPVRDGVASVTLLCGLPEGKPVSRISVEIRGSRPYSVAVAISESHGSADDDHALDEFDYVFAFEGLLDRRPLKIGQEFEVETLEGFRWLEALFGNGCGMIPQSPQTLSA